VGKFIDQLISSESGFNEALRKLVADRSPGKNIEVTKIVDEIIESVRVEGDPALLRYTNKFDHRQLTSPRQLAVSVAGVKKKLERQLLESLERSFKRITAFHQKQKDYSWEFTDDLGIVLGQKVTPLDSVGIYVPGGTASYPSSVFMNAIPAMVAGVQEIVMVVPSPGGVVSEAVLGAAEMCGINMVFSVGGAQAVAALAFGTETVPKVDKIVGPGNIFVAEAKRKLYGTVGVDMVAGPSEIVIVCDGTTRADWVAMDLMAQAEHDENAQAILITTKKSFLKDVEKELSVLVEDQPRSEIILKSLRNHGALIQARDLGEAFEIVNYIAPEHLELSMQNPREHLPRIKHAGAIFLGKYTPESFGDYCAGPNHVLPTSGSARFASPLGVYDFQKRTSIIECNAENALEMGSVAFNIANAEGLTAHARSALMRKNPK
tara:strand:+ start:3850 stop:5151 length:1302 start_codon:yes stop_codon:yes gene_type:complete